ncbi:hypothetical protein [Nocardioides sp.]|uniref:hypothetical protein n=1 Tax=Nocardioides sp. TaxID=35761 RepID=UPI0035117956
MAGRAARSILVVDAANVVGAKPNGWWKDRAGAAQRLHEALLVADLGYERVVLVLEGGAKAGVKPGRDAHVQVVHAARDGDSEIVKQTRAAAERCPRVGVVTADRALAANVAALAQVHGPSWLWAAVED